LLIAGELGIRVRNSELQDRQRGSVERRSSDPLDRNPDERAR
jgi:hypothetical protein